MWLGNRRSLLKRWGGVPSGPGSAFWGAGTTNNYLQAPLNLGAAANVTIEFRCSMYVDQTNGAPQIGLWGSSGANSLFGVIVVGTTDGVGLVGHALTVYNNGGNTDGGGGTHNIRITNSHVAVTMSSAGAWYKYINGTQIYTGSSAAINAQSTFRIFYIQPSLYNVAGWLDEIRVWNVVRTQAQINANKAAEIDPTTTGLVAYWKLNKGSDLNGIDLSNSVSGGPALVGYGTTSKITSGGSLI